MIVKRLFFKNVLYEELMVPTRTGSLKLFKDELVEGDSYLVLVEKGFLIPVEEEETKDKEIRNSYYTQKYLLRA